MDIVRRCLAEFIGTFALVFIGVGSTFVAAEKGGGLLPVALAFGFVVAVMVASMGHISGGQINPAVTLALLATRKMTLHDALFYVLAQILGAVAGAGLLHLLHGGYHVHDGVPVPMNGFTWKGALVLEMVTTFILVFVIFGAAVDKRGPNMLAGLMIGLTVTVDILVAGIYTGASMNPARSFGPALIGMQWDSWWIYWVGPIAGGILAGVVYNTFFMVRANVTAARG